MSSLKRSKRSLESFKTLLSRVSAIVDVVINGKLVSAMVDSGATQNYVADRIAHKLGLKLCQDGSSIKAVNSPARLISGIANNVPIRIGTWAGKATFMAIPMDDFQMILGMEF